MQEKKVTFMSAGRSFAGRFFVRDDAPARPSPGVMLLHGGAGVGAHEIERARMLVELGYAVLVPDLLGEVFETRERGVQVITALVNEPAILRARLADALACLREHPAVEPTRIGAMGFCFGGLAALDLARSGADVRAVASFHGGLTTRLAANPSQVKASVLVCTGAADPFVTREHRSAFEDEMTGARADWQMHVCANAMHGFTERGIERPGCKYDERADGRSWSAMRALFDEVLAAEPSP